MKVFASAFGWGLCAAPCIAVLAQAGLSSGAAEGTRPSDGVAGPCIAHSPTSGLYFDLNAISLSPPQLKDGEKVHKGDRDESWHGRGYDYGANFTLNICAPVLEKVRDVVGVESARWKNVSAYYEKDGKVYSIGQQNAEPFFRGRKLVLNYTHGSPCPGERNEKSTAPSRTKSTMMSFLCDREALPSQATVSFVGSFDSCSYFFEVRSSAACGGVATNPSGSEGLGPAQVFGVIVLIAVVVYMIGGCAYQRTVLHQRGWRQCPNYAMWAATLSFVKDVFVISFSSLGRMLRLDKVARSSAGQSGSRRGGLIGAIGGGGGGRQTRDHHGDGGTAARADVDAENRLIDQLDEEWDD